MINRIAEVRSLIVSMICALVICGCGAKTPNYIPNPDVAEDAVRRVLERWKAGEPPGEVPGSRPLIHLTDGGRKPGQVLQGYQILGETRGTSGRTIAVALQLANPAEEQKARYIVLGIDPLLVFRQEDFDLLMHWDHHMPASTDAKSDAASSSSELHNDTSSEIEIEPLVTPEPAEAQR